jgi:hypothetical protein
MPTKDPAKKREQNKRYFSGYYQRNKDAVLTKNRAWGTSDKGRIANKERHAAYKAFLAEYKSKDGCFFCKDRDPMNLDFHHLRDKLFQIGERRQRMDLVMEEIKKCVVLCKECHRKLHNHARFG